ncbi:MAG: carboxypeptidase regulatory-like domain-containing protein [bacterium]
MKTSRYWSVILLLLGIAGAARAQDPGAKPRLNITPHEAFMQPGQGVKFDASVFGSDGRPQRLESVRWSVVPDTLGKITDDGFFIAGRLPGRGRVLAFAKIPELNELLQAEATVTIGRPDPPRVVIIVSPSFAIVPPGQSEQFKVEAISAANVPIAIRNVRWNVRPESLGRMDETGRFTAGREFGEGVIIAFVETDGGIFSGEARVTVAARPNSAIKGKVTVSPTTAAGPAGVVFAESAGPNRWRGEARIDDRGNYFIDKLIPGLYVVRAQVRGFLPEFYEEASDYLQATPVQLAANDTAEGIDFTLEKGGAIQGSVGGDDRDALLSGAHVVAILTVKPEIRYHAVSNEQGGYSIENLPSGTYAMFAEAEGYKSEYFDNAQSLLQARLIQVAAPQIVDGIHFSLAPGSAIGGAVNDAVTQAAIANAKIVIMPAPPATTRFVKIVETDEGGAYLASVPPGTYIISAEARGYLLEFYDGVRTPRAATIVEVKADERTLGVNFALDRLGSISGVVLEQNNARAPIPGALVLAFPERSRNVPPGNTPNAPFVGRTDDKGAYVIGNMPPGTYHLLAEARGYLNEFWKESPDLNGAQLVELGDGSGVSGIDFTLERGGAIAGTVLSGNGGQPLGGAQVQIWSRTSNATARGETDREGKYRVGGLRTGEYLVSVEARGFKPQFFDGVESRELATLVKVEAPNETIGIDFSLQPADMRRGAIAGFIVADADGSPLAEAVVLALPLQSGSPQLAYADRLGGYRLSGLAPGRYVVFAHAPRFVGEFYDNARSFQEARPVIVETGRETGGIDFQLSARQRGVYVIAGAIRRGNGDQGESNAVVFAMNNDVFAASALTDDHGNFVIDELPAGAYKVMATAPGGSAFFGGRDANSATAVSLGSGANASHVTFSVPGSATAVAETGSVLPAKFALEQNYPNPFNPETVIPYQLAGRGEVKLIVYNALGQEVRRLVSALQDAGIYRVRWDGKDNHGRALTSGVYIYRLITREVVFTRKMIYVR